MHVSFVAVSRLKAGLACVEVGGAMEGKKGFSLTNAVSAKRGGEQQGAMTCKKIPKVW